MPEAQWIGGPASANMPRMNRIKEIRKRLKVSQAKLADALGVDQSAVSKLENERIPLTIHQLRIIARTLGVSFGELEDPPPFSQKTIALARLLEGRPDSYRDLVLRIADTLNSAPQEGVQAFALSMEAFLGALQPLRPHEERESDKAQG